MTAPDTDKLIVFDANRLFDGLAYHAVQHQMPHWKHIYAITTESWGKLMSRLTKEQATATVSKFDWRHMTDHDRFLWLLDVTDTCLVERDGSGVGTFQKVKTNKPTNRKSDDLPREKPE